MHIRELDPSASPLDYYGNELRRARETSGFTQRGLGKVVFCTGSLIGQIETATKVPQREFSERVDVALGTDGTFSRLVGLVLRSQLPSWFQPFAELEARATNIATFQTQVVYGLLQTPEYARAVLEAGWADNLDDQVAARMDRQRIFNREKPPLTWVILDEVVLHRPFGGREVMRQQLTHLLSLYNRRELRVQVLPLGVGQHPATAGSFTILRFNDDPDITYSENYDKGYMTANPDVVMDCSHRYDHLQAAALSLEDSAALIARVREERYAEQPAPDRSAVA
ncbi:helix-turn-helix domain-containing protein [Streptomyces cylindrosporus]|uniref:Helix-turn-helix domain-containing protein n=1 Tax=Streptomyces cylindrosporus TaxID=2927583 RepID=A0ABS9Y4W5_9ACTN|nr:helix-turn-helix transcriptional regulator [Streptomyces cylindrosporus]MCI3272265.1 helix-turn-helix domain-containing protein [Streptomyces cylindrosporus]